MIPKKLRIQGHTFNVKLSSGDAVADRDCGWSRPFNNLISINSDFPVSQQESTLLHEIIEIINSSFELKLEHKQIMTLECSLYQVLKENKLLK
jgi:hypothetical protein